MVRSVPSFRKALDLEMAKWEGYREALREDERWAFDRMMESCKMHASAIGVVQRTNPLEAMFMSVLLEHQRKIEALEKTVKQEPSPVFS